MEYLEIETRFKELLLQVFSLESVDEIQADHSLVYDLGAESLDFVEILWLIEENFGVALKTGEVVGGGLDGQEAGIFGEDKLTVQGAAHLRQQFPHSAAKIRPGLSKIDIFSLITVGDLARLIQTKLAEEV